MGIAPRRPFERSNQIEPLDREWPCDGDCLEHLGQEMGLPSIVLAPFVGAHDLFNVGDYGWPVEALSEHVSDQGSRRGVMTANSIMDITQQPLPLLGGDAAL